MANYFYYDTSDICRFRFFPTLGKNAFTDVVCNTIDIFDGNDTKNLLHPLCLFNTNM